MKPIFKWLGGKRSSLEHIFATAAAAGWKGEGRVLEPFFGGGAFSFEALERWPEAVFWATDANARLMEAYCGVHDDIDLVIARLSHLEGQYRAAPEETYYDVRDKLNAEAATDVAARMIFLNRTTYNGLYRVNKKNRCNMPWGHDPDARIIFRDELLACSKALQDRFEVIATSDFRDVLERAGEGDLVYCDPPFVPLSDTSSFTAYQAGGFGPEAQVALRDAAVAAHDRGAIVLLSNHDTSETRDLYKDWDVEVIGVNRAINSKATGRGKVAELLISKSRT